jgi:hypothetical protein
LYDNPSKKVNDSDDLGDPFGAEEVKLLNNSETRSRFHGAKEG